MNDRLRILYLLGMILFLIHTEICYVICSAQISGKQQPIALCDTKKLPNGKLYADCSSKNLQQFPKFTEPRTIQILNISNNPFLSFKKFQFLDLTELEELIMMNAHLDLAEPDFLLALIKLRILNFSNTYLKNLKNIRLPPKLKKLYVNSLNIDPQEASASLQDLSDLEVLSAQLSGYTEFPRLNELCPINFIDLSGNDMSHFQYTDLAPFCTLKKLLLSNTKFHDSEACCGVKLWTSTYNISTSLTCIGHCEINKLDEKAKGIYEACELRLRGKGVSWKLYLVAFFFLMALLSGLLFLAYRYFSSLPVQAEPQLEEGEVEEVLDEEG